MFAGRVEPEFLTQVRELLRVHAAPISQQLAKRREAGGGEVGARHEGGESMQIRGRLVRSG